ncbi:m7GpppX diphosphatase-like isoform X1 [Lytechinus pictus]|uniref:m7GpppX diphosphatase-like isoform X1 n=1 Tax=Lytechinus pictus TaxID=7653 RepID=UPI0030B9C51B
MCCELADVLHVREGLRRTGSDRSPWINRTPDFCFYPAEKKWVYNILEKKAESERIVFEDADPEIGFVMLPDMKWDEKQTNNLYLIVIIHQRGIKSLRDLTASHLPLLRNIQEKCLNCIQDKYGIPADELRAYLHYQPSYYHLHVHFTHLKFDAPGTNVGRAHLLSSVIENIELISDYYQRKSLAYVLKENDGLLAKFREARCGNGK